MDTEIRLTPKEAEVIQHRLDVTDAMAQVFGPSGDDVWNYTTDAEAEVYLRSILDAVVTRLDDGGMVIKFSDCCPDHVLVVEELVDGNTMDLIVCDMCSQATDEDDYKSGQALKKHLRNINTKWENAGLSSAFDV